MVGRSDRPTVRRSDSKTSEHRKTDGHTPCIPPMSRQLGHHTAETDMERNANDTFGNQNTGTSTGAGATSGSSFGGTTGGSTAGSTGGTDSSFSRDAGMDSAGLKD